MLWSDYCCDKILKKFIIQCDMGEWKCKWKQGMHIVFTLYLPVKLKFYEELRSNFHSCTLYHVGHILLCKSLSLGCLNFNINMVLKSMCFFFISLFILNFGKQMCYGAWHLHVALLEWVWKHDLHLFGGTVAL